MFVEFGGPKPGAVVLKGTIQLMGELFATHLAAALGVRAPVMTFFRKAERPEVMSALTEAQNALGVEVTGKLRQGYVILMEYLRGRVLTAVPGDLAFAARLRRWFRPLPPFQPPAGWDPTNTSAAAADSDAHVPLLAADAPFPPRCERHRPVAGLPAARSEGESVMQQIGAIVALDLLCNYTDRLPFVADNLGNPGNLMLTPRPHAHASSHASTLPQHAARAPVAATASVTASVNAAPGARSPPSAALSVPSVQPSGAASTAAASTCAPSAALSGSPAADSAPRTVVDVVALDNGAVCIAPAAAAGYLRRLDRALVRVSKWGFESASALRVYHTGSGSNLGAVNAVAGQVAMTDCEAARESGENGTIANATASANASAIASVDANSSDGSAPLQSLSLQVGAPAAAHVAAALAAADLSLVPVPSAAAAAAAAASAAAAGASAAAGAGADSVGTVGSQAQPELTQSLLAPLGQTSEPSSRDAPILVVLSPVAVPAYIDAAGSRLATHAETDDSAATGAVTSQS